MSRYLNMMSFSEDNLSTFQDQDILEGFGQENNADVKEGKFSLYCRQAFQFQYEAHLWVAEHYNAHYIVSAESFSLQTHCPPSMFATQTI